MEKETIFKENLENYMNSICDLGCNFYSDLASAYEKCSKSEKEKECRKIYLEQEACFTIQ